MTRKQIQKFIDKFSGKYKVAYVTTKEITKNKILKMAFKGFKSTSAGIRFFPEDFLPEDVSIPDHLKKIDAFMYINRKQIIKDNYVKAVIFHELGHLQHRYQNVSHTQEEVIAESWALEQSKKSLPVYLAKINLVSQWDSLPWKNYRIYRMAFKKLFP
jgi:Zn-dependent peptidase ImmA (M78 family)